MYLAYASKSQSIIKGHQGKSHEKRCLLARPLAYMLAGSCLASFTLHPRTNCLGMVLPTPGWTLLHQLVIKTAHLHRGHRPLGCR